jgi:hypothetical protein
MNKSFIISFLLILFTTSCGFKPIQQKKLSNFHIAEINTIGDKRINFKIRNLLFFKSEDNSKKLIQITLNTSKEKNVKERNIKNEITKYQINILINVKFKEINGKRSDQFNIQKSGDYLVSKQHTQTLNDEKKLLELLTDDISEIIFNELRERLNAI